MVPLCQTCCNADCPQIREAGGAKAVERHTSRGKLLARQRIDQVGLLLQQA
jgi:acetyl-CoA carboxylase carboxyltransferase component